MEHKLYNFTTEEESIIKSDGRVHWPSIHLFHEHRSFYKKRDGFNVGPVTHRAKVKLHGTCAGIQRVQGSSMAAFSRECFLSRENDNAGFAKWALDQEWPMALTEGTALFGEWCGPGVANGATAVSSVKEKIFAVFAAITPEGKRIQDHAVLQTMTEGVARAFVLPWYGPEVVFDWKDTDEALQAMLDKLNDIVEEVEVCDPWIKDVFGIEGVGEGLVLYPISHDSMPLFKAKGAKHRVKKAKVAVQLDPTVVNSIEEFVELALPEPRLQQGFDATAKDGIASIKNMGAFMAWINKDVEKETKTELEATGLTMKQVNKPLSDKARAWFMAQLGK